MSRQFKPLKPTIYTPKSKTSQDNTTLFMPIYTIFMQNFSITSSCLILQLSVHSKSSVTIDLLLKLLIYHHGIKIQP